MGDGAGASSPRATTNGAMYYRSLQGVTLPDAPGAFESWGQPASLARMMRSYFNVAENCAARLMRVRWTGKCRPTIYLAWPSVVMIGMAEATFESSADRRAIDVAVTGGLLVKPEARPHLVIALERRPAGVQASVDLLDYQPRGGIRPSCAGCTGTRKSRCTSWWAVCTCASYAGSGAVGAATSSIMLALVAFESRRRRHSGDDIST